MIYNWDKVIDKIDPYRDGKSRERVNFYVNTLSQLISKYKNKNDAIINTNQLFKDKWGNDKILEI